MTTCKKCRIARICIMLGVLALVVTLANLDKLSL